MGGGGGGGGCASEPGFQVLAVTCDGAALNRKFMKLHEDKDELVYKAVNPHSDEPRPLLLMLLT